MIILTDDKTGQTKIIEAFPNNRGPAFASSGSGASSGGSASGASASASGSASCGSSCASASGSAGSASGSAATGASAQGTNIFGKLERATSTQQTNPNSPDIIHKQPVAAPKGMTDAQFRQRLENQASKYKNDKNYRPVPLSSDTANSNSMVFDSFRKTGVDVKPDLVAPGWDYSVYD
jgi:hypothetical protein